MYESWRYIWLGSASVMTVGKESYTVLVDNIDDGGELAIVLTVVDKNDTTDFNQIVSRARLRR